MSPIAFHARSSRGWTTATFVLRWLYDVDADRVKIPAGWMIDQCGWKGRSLGRAGVHDKQALVLVNRGGATGRDVLNLCEAIRHDVKTRFGIEIFPEVNIV